MMPWPVVWTGEVLMKFRKRPSDGMTSYGVMPGHRCLHPVLDLGETVMFRVAVGKSNRHKADSG